MIAKDSVILIVGLGLIGGSYAKGLKKHGYTVYAISRGQGTIDYALENGIIDKGTIQEEPEIISQADYIVFGLYPHTMIDWIARNQQYFKSGAIITDVCGVKCNVVDVVQDFLRKDVEFIGSHPMAGKEVSGVQYSDDAIFHSANFIITPTETIEKWFFWLKKRFFPEYKSNQKITSKNVENYQRNEKNDESYQFIIYNSDKKSKIQLK